MLKANDKKINAEQKVADAVLAGDIDDLVLHQYYDENISFDPDYRNANKDFGKVEISSIWKNNPRTALKPIKYGRDAIKLVLYRSNGVIGVAARALGVSRRTLKAWLDKDKDLHYAQQDAKALTVDFAESKLIAAVERGAPWAIQMVMRYRGDMIEPNLKVSPLANEDEKGDVMKAMAWILDNPELTPTEKNDRFLEYREKAKEENRFKGGNDDGEKPVKLKPAKIDKPKLRILKDTKVGE